MNLYCNNYSIGILGLGEKFEAFEPTPLTYLQDQRLIDIFKH